MSATIKAGFTFTHQSFLDPDWKPGPGQHYADGPKAQMVVTHVELGRVWYGYAGATKGAWAMDLGEFTKRYGGSDDPA